MISYGKQTVAKADNSAMLTSKIVQLGANRGNKFYSNTDWEHSRYLVN